MVFSFISVRCSSQIWLIYRSASSGSSSMRHRCGWCHVMQADRISSIVPASVDDVIVVWRLNARWRSRRLGLDVLNSGLWRRTTWSSLKRVGCSRSTSGLSRLFGVGKFGRGRLLLLQRVSSMRTHRMVSSFQLVMRLNSTQTKLMTLDSQRQSPASYCRPLFKSTYYLSVNTQNVEPFRTRHQVCLMLSSISTEPFTLVVELKDWMSAVPRSEVRHNALGAMHSNSSQSGIIHLPVLLKWAIFNIQTIGPQFNKLALKLTSVHPSCEVKPLGPWPPFRRGK